MIDSRLSIAVTHADGSVTRWGPEETDGKNIPNDLTFSTSVPGGFKDASCSLLRRLDQAHPDQDLFDTVTVYGPGGRVAWEGRAAQFPRSHSDSYRVTPGAVGWAAHLRDDSSFRAVYADRDLSRWRDPSVTRRTAIANTPAAVGSHSALPNPEGAPALGLSFSGGWAPANGLRAEGWYEAPPGTGIGEVYANWSTSTFIGTGAGGWAFQLHSSADDGISLPESSADQLTGAATVGTVTFTPATARRYVLAQLVFATGPAGSDGNQYDLYLTNLVVVGDHGLPVQGEHTSGSSGFNASDVIADAVGRAAPLLTYTTGAGGSIEATSFAIPHVVYPEPTTAEFVVGDVNKYHLYDWGVQENREFFYRQPNPDRLTWEARLGDGAHMDADGLTGEQVINGVFVTYPDPAGVTRTVGPPGGNFDATDAVLADTSSSNPINSHGIPAKWDHLTLSFTTTLEGAVQIGSVYLAERSLATRRGSLTLTGTVQHPTEGKVPVWRVRAGDWVKVTDLDGENASVPRKIIETSYTHSSRSISLSLDNTPGKLDAILSRVGIATGIMTGSGF